MLRHLSSSFLAFFFFSFFASFSLLVHSYSLSLPAFLIVLSAFISWSFFPSWDFLHLFMFFHLCSSIQSAWDELCETALPSITSGEEVIVSPKWWLGCNQPVTWKAKWVYDFVAVHCIFCNATYILSCRSFKDILSLFYSQIPLRFIIPSSIV